MWCLFLVSINKIMGKGIIGAKGYNLGEITGVEVNALGWKVTHLHVKLNSQAADELDFKKRFRSSTVCMPVSLVSAMGDVITMNKSVAEISGDSSITERKE